MSESLGLTFMLFLFCLVGDTFREEFLACFFISTQNGNSSKEPIPTLGVRKRFSEALHTWLIKDR
jgi:hypothetical protein